MVPHPPYSLDLAPCDFFLFPRLKAEMRGHRFRNLPDLKTAILRTLRLIPREDYHQSLQTLPIRWMKCVKAGGDYFEGRHLEVDPVGDHEIDLVFDNSEEEN